ALDPRAQSSQRQSPLRLLLIQVAPLSLHDALPICPRGHGNVVKPDQRSIARPRRTAIAVVLRRRTHIRGNALPWIPREQISGERSEEHTSELQSPDQLVCRLLLEKKNMSRRCVEHG